MATKYIVNKTKMAFKFLNGKVLERKGVLQVEDKDLEGLEKDYFFSGLKERGAIIVSSSKPESLVSAGAQIVANNAEIDSLKNKIKELESKLAKAEATGKDTSLTIDSNSDSVEEVEKKSKKK